MQMQATTPQNVPAQGGAPRWMWLAGAVVAVGATGVASALAWQGRTADSVETPVVSQAPVDATNRATDSPAPAARPARPAATVAACTNCGVVESVQAVKVKGEATGVGAVAGGVLGGVVGNQFGSGNGRAAMTVIGAVGGGVAGNEVEKHVKAKTTYAVRVRLDDGTLRNVTQAQPPAVGTRVKVDGSTLRAL